MREKLLFTRLFPVTLNFVFFDLKFALPVARVQSEGRVITVDESPSSE